MIDYRFQDNPSGDYNNRGFGKAMLARLAALAVEQGHGRLEWSCLDWNQPSIDFYLSLQAEPLNEWTMYRLTGENLQKMAKQMGMSK